MAEEIKKSGVLSKHKAAEAKAKEGETPEPDYFKAESVVVVNVP